LEELGTMKDGRDPLAANQTTNECAAFREFVASGLPNLKYELNHTGSEEKISVLLFEREMHLKKNICKGQATVKVT